MQRNDGGPAFPGGELLFDDGDCKTPYQIGMSLRDWFAGKALSGITAGLCANPRCEITEPCGDRAKGRVGFSHAAQDAYAIADAMLAAREARSDEA